MLACALGELTWLYVAFPEIPTFNVLDIVQDGVVWVLPIVITSAPTPQVIDVHINAAASGVAPENVAASLYSHAFTPVGVVLSSGVGPDGSTFSSSQPVITATFSQPVTGVTASMLAVDVAPLMYTSFVTAVSSTVYEFTLTLQPPLADATLRVYFPEADGLVPPNAASNHRLRLKFRPPRATLSLAYASSDFVSVSNNTWVVFADFSSPVSGVQVSNFAISATSYQPTFDFVYTTSLESAGGSATDSVWVLTILLSPTASVVSMDVSVTMNSDPGTITPATGTPLNSLAIQYVCMVVGVRATVR